MTRSLGLFLVFCMGLAAAVLWFGQMHQLRRALPDQLPAWTEMLQDTASARSGTAVLPAQDGLPEVTLRWEAKRPSVDGLLWDLSAIGQGIDFKFELVLPFWPSRAILHSGAGSLDLARLTDPATPVSVTLSDVSGEIASILDGWPVSADLTGQARAAVVGGFTLGQGPLQGQLAEAGDWWLDITLADGLAKAAGKVSGALGNPNSLLEMTVDDFAALPEPIQQVLQPLGVVSDNKLAINTPLVFR